jgi:phospholipase C
VTIGASDPTGANHQYDSHDFFDALSAGSMPNVVFLKAPGYQDGHAGYSSPRDEQIWLADTINQIEESKFWDTTAVLIMYDDSDGWYDHQMGPIIMHSQQTASAMLQNQGDALTGPGLCGSSSNGLQAQGRCGYGPRLPFLVVSPWAKTNFVDHTVTDQSSAIAFIEKNFGLTGPIVAATSSDAGSYEQYAGPLDNMFDFTQSKGEVNRHKVFIDPNTGEVLKKAPKSTTTGGNEP